MRGECNARDYEADDTDADVANVGLTPRSGAETPAITKRLGLTRIS